MIMRYMILLSLIYNFFSCTAQTNKKLELRDIILNDLKKDTIITFINSQNDTTAIFREVEIYYNENEDTVILGYSLIPPRFTGKVRFIQHNLDQSSAVYLDRTKELDTNNLVSFAKLFTIGLWNKKYDRGFKKIGLKVKIK